VVLAGPAAAPGENPATAPRSQQRLRTPPAVVVVRVREPVPGGAPGAGPLPVVRPAPVPGLRATAGYPATPAAGYPAAARRLTVPAFGGVAPNGVAPGGVAPGNMAPGPDRVRPPSGGGRPPAAPSAVAAPSAAVAVPAVSAETTARNAAVDVDRLAEVVERRIVRRFGIEAERRGRPR